MNSQGFYFYHMVLGPETETPGEGAPLLIRISIIFSP